MSPDAFGTSLLPAATAPLTLSSPCCHPSAFLNHSSTMETADPRRLSAALGNANPQPARDHPTSANI
ncbi:MAG: hypothetical protein WDW38_006985 [Sanguina aurantia]